MKYILTIDDDEALCKLVKKCIETEQVPVYTFLRGEDLTHYDTFRRCRQSASGPAAAGGIGIRLPTKIAAPAFRLGRRRSGYYVCGCLWKPDTTALAHLLQNAGFGILSLSFFWIDISFYLYRVGFSGGSVSANPSTACPFFRQVGADFPTGSYSSLGSLGRGRLR